MDIHVPAGLRQGHPALPDKLDRLDPKLSAESSSPHDPLRLYEGSKFGVHQTGSSSCMSRKTQAPSRRPSRFGAQRPYNRNLHQHYHEIWDAGWPSDASGIRAALLCKIIPVTHLGTPSRPFLFGRQNGD